MVLNVKEKKYFLNSVVNPNIVLAGEHYYPDYVNSNSSLTMGATGFDGIETLLNCTRRSGNLLKHLEKTISADYGYMAAA